MNNIFTVKGKSNLLLLVLLVILIEGGAFLSGRSAGESNLIYQYLNKPGFAPPGWVFPIVWTILYFLMSTALYRILLSGNFGKRIQDALKLFGIQLLLNYIWTPIFFRWNLYGIAFLVLLVLLYFIIRTMVEFSKIDSTSTLLMVPYLLWVTFATVLSYYIWILN